MTPKSVSNYVVVDTWTIHNRTKYVVNKDEAPVLFVRECPTSTVVVLM